MIMTVFYSHVIVQHWLRSWNIINQVSTTSNNYLLNWMYALRFEAIYFLIDKRTELAFLYITLLFFLCLGNQL